MSTIPEKMKALVIKEGHTCAVEEVPVPTLGDNQVLVEVEYTGINQLDWKNVEFDFMGFPGDLLGCEFSGYVVKLGPNLASNVKLGAHVAGMPRFYKGDVGTHAQFVAVDSDLVFNVPENLYSAGAATLPVPLATSACSLYQVLKVPFPPDRVDGEPWILCYGGSSTTGMVAIQLAKVAGYRVVSAASKRNHKWVKHLGADAVFEYTDPVDTIKQIRAVTHDSLTQVVDFISNEASLKICLEVFSSDAQAEKNLVMLMPLMSEASRALAEKHKDVKITMTSVASVFDKDRAMYVKLNEIAPALIAKRLLLPNPVVERHGIEGIPEGLLDNKQGRISAAKLVYKITD